jgi:hypothetical protein
MKQISVRVDDELREAIDKARGQIPREAWMRTVLAAAAGNLTAKQSAGREYASVMAERQRNLEKARKR